MACILAVPFEMTFEFECSVTRAARKASCLTVGGIHVASQARLPTEGPFTQRARPNIGMTLQVLSVGRRAVEYLPTNAANQFFIGVWWMAGLATNKNIFHWDFSQLAVLD